MPSRGLLAAALAYFAATFAVAFALGALRETVVAPRLGGLAAVALEVPILLTVSWFTARWAVRRFAVAERASARLVMGAVAFGLLQAVELGFAAAFGTPPSVYLGAVATAKGALGMAAQVAFALMPLVVGPADRR